MTDRKSWRHSLWRLRMAWLEYRIAQANRHSFLLYRAHRVLTNEEPTT